MQAVEILSLRSVIEVKQLSLSLCDIPQSTLEISLH